MRNKIYLLALLLLLMHLPTLAQIGGDYNPSNPGDPGTPVLKYNLTLKAVPTDGGSFSVTSTKVSVGENYNIRAYSNTDFVFVAWICDGDTISKSASYNITMPDHDVEITGVFRYNPSSPADPQEQALKYQLSLRAEPMNSGSFNINNERLAVGSINTLRAYTNTDFVFKHWRMGDSILSTSQNMDFTMPAHNVEIIGQFEYNPANPDNPNANYWNPITGEVIVDDFSPGYLSNAISTLLSNNNANRNEVMMITVAGVMTSNDFGIVNNYTNCTLLDISRVTGITEVPSYAFDYTNLESVYLPATIEKIGDYAFSQCTLLSSMVIYAMTPPAVGRNVFNGVPDGLVVYVPVAAISLYQDDPNWSKFIILPIQEDIRTLTVNLPSGANPADYANLWLELTNTKSGQRMHYVMDNRSSYKFNNIIRNTTWDVVLRNPNGDIFGKIENVEVGDDDVTVTFASLSKPYNVTLSVLTPSGQDVTSQAEVTWTDAAGNYISQETSVAGLPVGYQLQYSIRLTQELAMAYNAPANAQYTVKNGSNAIVCQLTAISKVTVKGKVKDAATGLPLNGANITASQTFGGKYDQTVSTKSDGSGAFSFEIAQVPTVIAASASDYINKTVDCDVMAVTGEITLLDVALDPITGATIAIDFTFTPSHADGENAETQNWYSDYNNVDYAIFNKTKNRSIDQFSAQFPQIVLLEDVNDGNVLELTATSRKAAFNPVKTTVTIAGQKANATFNIIELGKIAAAFKKNSNPTVVGSLYDANGKLVNTYEYSDAALEIGNLADGKYTLVTMGESQFFNTVYDLNQLSQTGLVSGVDYVQSAVEVKSGLISNVDINNVPLFDESKLYYTGENTSFTVNKPSIVIGNYLTMTGHIDFKPAYATQVENVSMIVDIPESCSFVENSVMVGNNSSGYSIYDNQITIPMVRYTDRVRFCVIPTVGGDFAPSAFVQFDLNGKTIKQPIGAANYTAQELSIKVPSKVARETIPISGTAIGTSSVEIYDNGVLIGQTTSLANGNWSMKCQLHEPSDFSVHSIYAKTTTKSGLELKSEAKDCVYDKNAVEVLTVTMIYRNHVTVFDYQDPDKPLPSYSYAPSCPDFTFLIDLAYHDRSLIPYVWLHVFTTDGKVRSLRADYDETTDRWIVVDKFTSGSLPTQVSVTVEDMVYDISSETTYEKLLDEYVGEIHLKETNEDSDGKSTSIYTDSKGDDILSITSYETELSGDQVIDNLKQEGFEEDEFINDESDYVPESEDDILDENIKVLTDSVSGSIALVATNPSMYVGARVAIIRLVREEDKNVFDSITTTITRTWKQFCYYYLVKPGCTQTTIHVKEYTEYLEKHVQIITSTLVAHTVYVDYRLLPPGTKIPSKEVLAKLRRVRHSSKRYTKLTKEYTIPPKTCPPPPPPEPPTPPTPPVPPVIDPSGFVYEGVPSNRLQGVTTTCFYKETVADMYGDLHDEVVLWDATQYGQENPIFTDENGYYGWDVPVGLWQVKYEKAGYETTYSDWLPVPPPQLDINVAMTQMRQPEVIKARAYTKAVEFEFDKYMKPETLTTDNISVVVNGEAVDGTIQLLNEEMAYDTDETFASRVRFNAASPFNADEVTLHVFHKVESYAGLRMSDDYEQTLTVEYEMEKIDVDSTINVPYGESRELTVTVLPANASKGKTLTVRNSSPMILATDAESYKLDTNGKAVVTIHGDLPGTGSLLFGVDGYDLSAATLVNVLMEDQMNVAMPTASVASGSEVHRGTAVYLRCATEGATIYYTLDGSCPCDPSPARKVYDGTPIIINGTVTIKAMATAPNLYDSEVATFTYKLSTEVNGDVNRDGEVNIADVNAILDVILSSYVNSDVKSRADVNGDGEVNIADINAVIDIILNPANNVGMKVNCDDLLHVEDVTMKPGDVRTLQVTLDRAARYSAVQCDLVLPAGLTLVDAHAVGANVMRMESMDDFTNRVLSYSMNKLPFVGDRQPVMTFTVRADAALAPESEITLTHVVLADAANKAWRTGDCTARVNNATGITDVTATASRVWVEKHTLCIESSEDGTARIATVSGMVRDLDVKAGITRHELEPGIYVVILDGQSYKISVK